MVEIGKELLSRSLQSAGKDSEPLHELSPEEKRESRKLEIHTFFDRFRKDLNERSFNRPLHNAARSLLGKRSPVIELSVSPDLSWRKRRVKLLFDPEIVRLKSGVMEAVSPHAIPASPQYRSKQVLIEFDNENNYMIAFSARVEKNRSLPIQMIQQNEKGEFIPTSSTKDVPYQAVRWVAIKDSLDYTNFVETQQREPNFEESLSLAISLAESRFDFRHAENGKKLVGSSEPKMISRRIH